MLWQTLYYFLTSKTKTQPPFCPQRGKVDISRKVIKASSHSILLHSKLAKEDYTLKMRFCSSTSIPTTVSATQNHYCSCQNVLPGGPGGPTPTTCKRTQERRNSEFILAHKQKQFQIEVMSVRSEQ